MNRQTRGWIFFDWGNTLMRDFPEFSGPMKDWSRLEALPHAGETLAALHPDWRLALATGADVSTEADIRAALDRVQLGTWLERIYCPANTGLRKNSPDFYLHILGDLGITPGQAVMVGDNLEADVQIPNRCRMRSIWLNHGAAQVLENASYRSIRDLSEIPSLLREWTT